MVKLYPILAFKGEYSFLSNFYPSPTPWEGIVYPSAEHAYQAAKTTNPNDRRIIQEAATPYLAKHMGRRVILREDWEDGFDGEFLKYHFMFRIVQNKFNYNPSLLKQLLATTTQQLVEGNTWRDYYWGAVKGKDGLWKGNNKLGTILMELRDNCSEYF